MAGLLDDLLGNLNSDSGLLGLAMLSAAAPRERRTTLGEGLMSGLTLVNQRKLQREEQAMRQAEMRMREQDFGLRQRQAGLQEQQIMQALEAQKRAQEQAQQRQRYLGSVDQSQGPAMPVSMAGGMAAGLAPQEVAALMPRDADPMAGFDKVSPKDYTPESLAEFAKTRNPAVLRAAPKPQEPDEFERVLRLANIDPASALGRQLATERAKKMATHQPAVQNINYGTPMPAINPATGKVELVRPDNKGGMSFTGVEPPPQNRDTKLPAEIQRMNIAADSMVSLLGDYEKWLAKNNPRDPTVQMSPARRAEMQSLMKNIQLQYKELAALGALAGPDLALMEAALTDPFTFKGAWYGPSGLRSQITQARNLVDVRRKAIGSNSGGQQQQAQPADDDPLGLRK